ncbi:hypothetical protein HHL16_23855 [Pseudoflavitalea sp. G-6-1-2]|uniref:hypothetical protein n=1 Tax=Pseudoflavitalea sp. G-6-1-2 TaxID=2728841 RepID=UPI00146A1CD8|nr:hypothetical protein [Pseudoflavitalea sp. G-6-1-2]NML23937.1 hypothetical protein [Pseudoflavitalea sp. G-6-1-2]
MSAALTISLIAPIILLLFYQIAGRNNTLLLYALLWLALTGSICATGLFKIKPVFFPLLMLATILLTIFCYRKLRFPAISVGLLLGIHALRVPVELVLYSLYQQKKIPLLMTFEGWNFDILFGLSALFLLLRFWRTGQSFRGNAFLIWNLIGMISLTAIVLMAILSSPLPIQQFGFKQPNIGLLEFPFCWLPVFIVPIVYCCHFRAFSDRSSIKHLFSSTNKKVSP